MLNDDNRWYKKGRPFPTADKERGRGKSRFISKIGEKRISAKSAAVVLTHLTKAVVRKKLHVRGVEYRAYERYCVHDS